MSLRQWYAKSFLAPVLVTALVWALFIRLALYVLKDL